MSISIRRMSKSEADIGLGMRLKEQAGWNQTPGDWERFLVLEPEGCFVAERDGVAVGTGVVTTYGRRLAWIGMILVDESSRRRGVGRAIMLACLDFCRRRGTELVKLDATPLGNRLYLTLGFVEEFLMDRRQGRGRAYDCRGVTSLEEKDLDEAVAFDAANFGVARPRVIERFYRECPRLAFVTRDGQGRLDGLLLGRTGQNAWQIGPWQAVDPAQAEELLKAALTALAGQPVFFDIVAPNRAVLPLVSRYGFTHQRPFVRMYLGQNRYPGRPEQVFAISGVEKG